MEKVMFTSGVINDEHHIYFLSKTNCFELYKFCIKDSFIETLKMAYTTFKKEGIFVSDMFISFSQYNNVVVGLGDHIIKIDSFDQLLDICGIKANVHVMVPDRLKDKVKLI